MFTHDLKTPLTSMTLRVGLLKRELGQILKHVSAIEEAIEIQKDTIENTMMAFGAEDELAEINFDALAAELKTLFDPMVGVKSLSFSLNDARPVVMRRTSTKQILINLITNAIYHAKNQVTVTMTCNENTVRFSIKDDGDGVPVDLLPYVFEPFVKGARSLGSGLGLAIVRELVRQQSGHVWVKNSASGAEFVVEIPLFHKF